MRLHNQSHLPLFVEILGAKPRHLNRNLYDREFCVREQKTSQRKSFVQVGHANLPVLKHCANNVMLWISLVVDFWLCGVTHD